MRCIMIDSGRSRREGEGFTLVEMLIVVAILVVLAAFLVPTAGRMQAKAKETQCIANLKKLHQGVVTYCADNSGWLPFELPPVGDSANWHRRIHPYLSENPDWVAPKNLRSWPYACPVDTDPTPHFSYAFNENLNRKRLSSRSGTVLILDLITTSGGNTRPSTPGGKGSLDLWLHNRHDGRNNILFEDGHVEARKRSEIDDSATNPAMWGLE
jgi:prepilin-type N-terminal cleavage/methylation domain-containing protein/prepilin-type processing-associated H-X9-DG protein